MTAWKENDQIAFNFQNAHEINNIRDGSSEATIKAKLRERLENTKVFVVLIGEHTQNLYKYVRWEIEYAVQKDLAVIAVNLNKMRSRNEKLCPPILADKLAMHVSYEQAILDYALNNWHAAARCDRRKSESGAYTTKRPVRTPVRWSRQRWMQSA